MGKAKNEGDRQGHLLGSLACVRSAELLNLAKLSCDYREGERGRKREKERERERE